ncbi:MAG TPA: hypothetical protein PL181_17185 [bacterium]|nr:hypothetical protein [bacterium]
MKRITIIEEEEFADSLYTVVKAILLAVVIVMFLYVWVQLPA